jgi:hypothetical protein
VPKINNPESVNDFWPIYLLNSGIKIPTKILADRLQELFYSFSMLINMVLLEPEPFKIALLGVLSTFISVITVGRKLSSSNLILPKLLTQLSMGPLLQ